MRTEKNRTALAGASRNAARAFEALKAPEFSHVPPEEKSAWAMAALIHCDICRLVIAYAECEREGIARLLCMSDISSKLYEARNWYSNAGTALLRGIAARKPYGLVKANKEIEHLKITHQVHRINKYADYRNRIGYHYDEQALQYLEKFSNEDAEEFFEVLTSFVKFAGAWAQLTKDLIQSQ
ncbi:hypothetical protein [Hydrogenophaga sp. RWCD_12]|uniref:hypothetical protein n=1 Tax=Hydrogenophaga sp. RWCD_12 TaxID=3391190 RepID=UPI0039847A14